MMHKASVAGEYDEEITRLAESIAGSIGCSLEQLYNQPLKASQRQYIEPTDVDEARTLLFSPPGTETYIRLYNKHHVISLPEQNEDINVDAELISYLIYIEQIEREGQKPKFSDLMYYMEPWKMVRLLNLMPWYFDDEVALA